MATIEKEKAIDVVKQMVADGQVSQEVAEKYFPELTGSEDEKVRKALIEMVHDTTGDELWVDYNVHKEEALAWLEKQFEQKPAENKGMNLVEEEMTPFQKKVFCIIDTTIEEEQGLKQVCDELLTLASNEIKQKPTTEIKSAEESLGIDSETYNKIVDECIYGEQKPADKVEPKFKVGDWIVYNDNLYHIGNIALQRYYECLRVDGTVHTFSLDIDSKSHLWTIQDAKDGDVLAFYSKYKGNKMVQVGIIEKYVGKHGGCSNAFKIYVGVNWDNNLQIGDYMGCSDIRPATKKQRDTLMKAMAKAGYTFDFEKKELKKIGQNSAWSEEDEAGLSDALWCCKQAASIAKDENDMGNVWYAEHWLKSLKDRYAWNPSDEQMKALDDVISSRDTKYDVLSELWKDLKKLKDEK